MISEKPNNRPKRRRGCKALWLGLIVLLAVVGGRWAWRQVQFSRLRIPLIQAVKAGNTARVRELLEQGADPDVRMNYKPEPLTWASLWRMLRGTKPTDSAWPDNLADWNNGTVLEEAVERDHFGIVQLLLDHNADVNLADRIKCTPLACAVSGGNIGCVKALLAHGADVNVRDYQGSSPLVRAVDGDERKGVLRNTAPDRSCVGLLLAHGANVNVEDDNGVTPLHWAAQEPLSPTTYLLIQQGADLNARDRFGRTALMLAARDRTALGTDVVRILLRSGADVNAQDEEGKTALWYCLEGPTGYHKGSDIWGVILDRTPSLALIQLLIENKADLRLKDMTGKTALQVAEDFHKPEAVALLRKAAARTSTAGGATGRGSERLVRGK